jgi:hypothetical protein
LRGGQVTLQSKKGQDRGAEAATRAETDLGAKSGSDASEEAKRGDAIKKSQGELI